MRWAALVIAAGLLGCVPPQVGTSPTVNDSASEAAYQELLKKYSAHSEEFTVLDTKAFLATTYQSLAFRQARAKRRAEFKVIPPAELQADLEREQAEFQKGPEFFVGLYVTDYHYDDLDKKDSVWRVALVTEAGEVTPVSVRRVGRATYDLRGYYPYLGDFWTAYSVRFPAAFSNGTPLPSTGSWMLRIASTLGQAQLKVPTE